jgi:branched-chain amino acid transport system ATP-binding protein
MISGLYSAPRGKVMLAGRDVTNQPAHLLARQGLSRTFQNLQIFFRMTALENVMVGRHLHENRNVLAHLFRLPSVVAQNRASRERAEELLALVGLSQLSGRSAGELPYGALKRLEIARALAAEPKVLLLDEPAAGCNAVETAEVDAVIQKIAAQGITVVLVEHDMKLVMKISNRIHVLDQGRTLAQGTAQEVRTNPAVVAAYLGAHAGGEVVDAGH